MRLGALGAVLIVTIAATGCGFATSPTPATSFALDAGNYTLKVSGFGTCSSGTIEGSGPVTVARTGTVWVVRSTQAADSFAMSLTTDGAVSGSVHGDISGTLSGTAGSTTSPVGSISGNNSGTNIAGGPITSASGGIASVVTFGPSGGSCLSATWTLTPR